ncbi:hypothetical protein GGR50DRAFT_473223 [Xylaria sp. CBS 124048]|nr:hypothetical protein GGR50DRAFT_473223 [Xylaria sp. CBS 124048]
MATAAQTTSARPRTTATVREYTCLFTHDLRKKQKRWRDGRLKYHTFNKRVMVYDDQGHYVGDTHWQEDYDLADGDEVQLERGGIVVQIGDCVEKHDQDLSELVDKRAQEKVQRQAAAAARRSSVSSVATPQAVRPQIIPQKHLHSVIGTPSGHHGRAVIPTESPYEERQREQALQSDGPRSAKRRRTDVAASSKKGYAQNLFGATLNLSGRSLSQAPVRHGPLQTSQARTEMSAPPSPSASGYSAQSSSAVRTIKTRIASPKPLSHATGQKSLRRDSAQIPTTAIYGPRSPVGLQSAQDATPVISDKREPEKAQTPHHRKPKSIVDGEKLTDSRSVLDRRHANRQTGVSKAIQRADAKPSALPTTGVSTKRNRDKKRPNMESDYTQEGKSRVAKDRVKGTIKDPAPDEPMIELKIKPRKKRGLLMVTERDDAMSKTQNLRVSSKVQPTDIPVNGSDGKANAANAEHNCVDKGKSNRNRDVNSDGYMDYPPPRANGARYPVEVDESDEIQCLDRGNKQNIAASESEKQSTEEAVDAGRRLRTRKQTPNEDDAISSAAGNCYGRFAPAESRNDANTDEQPLRLAKLSRRGINSKEVIGLVFSDETDQPVVSAAEGFALGLWSDHETVSNQNRHQQKSHTTGDNPTITEARPEDDLQSRAQGLLPTKESTPPVRQNSGSLKLAQDVTNSAAQNDEVSSISTTKRPIPSLANPATRGKKAAKPFDAVGTTPMCPLPKESPSYPPPHQRVNNVGAPEKMTENPMPGFSRANGGPWSREAYDLFDFRRPP